MNELPPKFLAVHTWQDRPATDDEPRMAEAHGYTPEELAEVLNRDNYFDIGTHRWQVVDRMVNQLRFTMKIVPK